LAAYTLLVSHFKRDRMTKLNIFPMAVIPVALTVFAIVTDQIIEPFSKSFFGRDSVFHIAILLSFLVAVYSANLGIKVSNHPESTWIFYSYPLQSRKMFLNGVRKFLVIYLLVPVVIFLLLIFSLVIPFYQVLAHVFYIFTAVSLFNSLVSAFGKDFPFSRENTLFNSIYRIASMLFPFLFGIVCVLIQIFAYKSILRSVITSIIIFLLTLLLNHFSFKRKNLDKQFFYLKT
jgi:hypothetical protein